MDWRYHDHAGLMGRADVRVIGDEHVAVFDSGVLAIFFQHVTNRVDAGERMGYDIGSDRHAFARRRQQGHVAVVGVSDARRARYIAQHERSLLGYARKAVTQDFEGYRVKIGVHS
jgi:hypothetical protein